MEAVLLLLTCTGPRLTQTAMVSRVGGAVLVYVVGLVVWWVALYIKVVPVFQWLAARGIYRTEGVIGGLLIFAPPLLGTAMFLYGSRVECVRGR